MGGRFCSECGSQLATAAAGPTESVVSDAPTTHVAERRITSVLFGDLVGFTTLSENRDPEEVRELLSRYFSECRTVIGRYGGTVEKFIGDAVMAVWGVPVTHEDDAERAVRAGLELTSVVAGIGEDVGAPGLAMRVGVVTGEVAVTLGATSEGMVAGDAVNTAARVQTAADPGRVWVDDGTRSLTAASIAYEDTGEHVLKGKAEPMQLFAARAIVGELGGAVRVDGLEAPLVGRDRELRLLKELFHATEESRRPRLVVVDGEAGIGKSRLAWEFEKYVDGLSATVLWHRGRCLSYGDGVAYWALAEAVRTRLGMTEGDTGDIVEQRLDEGLARYVADDDERAWLRPRLAVLVRSDRAAEFTRAELFVAWTTWFERVAEDGNAVVLVVDDAQHADDGLLDFADHLLSAARSGVFVLALARPELLARRAGLGGRRATVVRLDPLDTDAMARLVDGLVDGLSRESREALVRRAEGVPLFAVETVRALIDRDAVVPRDGRYVPAEGAAVDLDSIGAPVSLQTLVAARLDALTPPERHVVADASVLGATFTREGLVALGGDRSGLDDALESLQRKEILAIQQDRFAADRGQFRFVQTVVRQVAYSTQSRRDRKARHLSAADHLACLPEAEELALVVAQHLIDAVDASAPTDPDVPELTERAARLLEQAAHRARSLGSSTEARRLFESALARADEPTDHARLSFETGVAAGDSGAYADAVLLFASAAEQYDRLDRPVDAGLAAGWQAICLHTLGDSVGTVQVAQPRWDALLSTPGAEPALMRLGAALANAAAARGDMTTAMEIANRRVRFAERTGDPTELARSMIMLAVGYTTTGAPETARALVEASARHARLGGSLDVLSNALNNLSSQLLSRDLGEAEDAAREGLDIARRSGVVGQVEYTTINLAMALYQSGRMRDALQALDSAPETISTSTLTVGYLAVRTRIADAVGEPLPDLPTRESHADPNYQGVWLDLAVQHALAAGDLDLAGAYADEALPHVLAAMGIEDDFALQWPLLVRAAIESGDADRIERLLAPVEEAGDGVLSPAVRAEWHWLRAVAGAALGDDPAIVESEFREGIAELDSFGARGMAARAREDLGHWLVQQGRSGDAEPLLEAARSAYQEIGALGWLMRFEAWQREHAVV